MTGAAPEDVDTTVPNVARIYDHLLGGAHNFAVDRDRARQVVAVCPQSVPWARANRAFLRHTVEHALRLGVDQFLDLGSGIPTAGNVHEIALRQAPRARVAYVDQEPVAVAHSAAILADEPSATITAADVRDADAVLSAPGVADHLDFARPIALLAVAVLHFVPDRDGPAAILRRYRASLAAGSIAAVSHNSFDYPDDPGLRERRLALFELYASTSNPVHDRSRAELRHLVETAGFTVDADGVVPLDRWATPPPTESLGGMCLVTEPR